MTSMDLFGPPRLSKRESAARVRVLRQRGCKVERRRLPNGDIAILKSGCRLEENPREERWELQRLTRAGEWRKIPNSDTFETGEDATVELRRYKEADLERPNSHFRVHRTLRDNPNGDGTAVIAAILAAGAVGLVWLFTSQKKKEPAAATPTPPPVVPAPPVTTPVTNFVPPKLPSQVCQVTQSKFDAWLTATGKQGTWAANVSGAPPNAADVKIAFPVLASVPNDKLVVATNGGNTIWYFHADGEPYTFPKIKLSLCAWINANMP